MPFPEFFASFDSALFSQFGLNGLVLICLACWGIWGIFDKKALDHASSLDVLFAMLICQLPQVPIFLTMLNYLHPGWTVSGPLVLFCSLGSIVYAVSMICYVTAMSKADAGYVLGFTAGYPLVAQLLAVLLLGEKLVPGLMFGGLLIAAGVFSVGLTGEKHLAHGAENEGIPHPSSSSPLRDVSTNKYFSGHKDNVAVMEAPVNTEVASENSLRLPQNRSFFSKHLVPICVAVATITWGVKGLFDKVAVGMAPPLVVYYVELIANLMTLIPFITYYAMTKKMPQLQARQAWKYTALSTILLAIGGWSYLAALGIASASYVITITGCYPLLMYGFTILFLNEKFNKTRLIGISLIVLGGICVQLNQA